MDINVIRGYVNRRTAPQTVIYAIVLIIVIRFGYNFIFTLFKPRTIIPYRSGDNYFRSLSLSPELGAPSPSIPPLHNDRRDDAPAQLKSTQCPAIVSYLNVVVFGALQIRTSGGRAREPAAVVRDGRAGGTPETARPARHTM